MTNGYLNRVPSSFRLPIRFIAVLVGLLILPFLLSGCYLVSGIYPGWSGVRDGAVTNVPLSFDSWREAENYLLRIDSWEWEMDGSITDVGRPSFTIVNQSVDNQYSHSYLKTTAPVALRIRYNASSGIHGFKVTGFDQRHSPMVEVTGSVLVYPSKTMARWSNVAAVVVIGIAFLLFLGRLAEQQNRPKR